MTKPSPYELGYRTVATARAIIKSPANVTALPWVAITMQELANHERRNELTRDSVRLDDSELITGY